jgi:hypothetical protein
MNHSLFASAIALALFAALPGQEPNAAPPAVKADKTFKEEQDKQDAGGTWSEGFGRATNYRSALANALEDAVGKVKGISVARGPALRSRLSVVSEHSDGDKQGWFDGEADSEREWVQQQIAGFVLGYEVVKKDKGGDGQWEVTVKAQVASRAAEEGVLVIDLADSDLRRWQLERSDEEVPGSVTKQAGEFAGPKIGEYLRKTRLVKIVAKGAGVQVGEGSAVREREKAGHQLVASHRVTIAWQPIVVQSLIEKPNKARPSSRPRPEYLTGGSVQVSIRVEDLVENVELLDETMTVPADGGSSMPVEQIDAYVNALVDKAKGIVAEKVFFTLRPPVVLRKWQEGTEWRVEVRMSKRIAASYRAFLVGNNGSLSSPDWQSLGGASLLEGGESTCILRLEGVDDPSRIEPDVTEVRPIKS